MTSHRTSPSAALVAALALAGCAATPDPDEKTTVTMRLWDDQVADAYERAFAQFEREHPTSVSRSW